MSDNNLTLVMYSLSFRINFKLGYKSHTVKNIKFTYKTMAYNFNTYFDFIIYKNKYEITENTSN